MMKICILVDSGSTIKDKSINGYDIFSVPLTLTDKNNKSFLDSEISDEEIYKQLKNKVMFTTSCTPLGILEQKVTELSTLYDKIIFFPIPAGISSQYNNANILLEDFKDKLIIINTHSSEYITYDAIESFTNDLNNNVDIAQSIKNLDDFYKKTISIFTVSDLSGLNKGGRVMKFASIALQKLNGKPIVIYEDKNHIASIKFKFNSVVNEFVKILNKQFNSFKKAIIKKMYFLDGYINEKDKTFFLNTISKSLNFPLKEIKIVNISKTVICHTMPGACAIQIVCSEPHIKNNWN